MTELESTIAKLLFDKKLKPLQVAKMVGYSERQIYRIKKKLKEGNYGTTETRKDMSDM